MLTPKRDHNARANCRIRTHAPADVIYLRAGEFYYRGGKTGGVLRCVGVDALAAVPATEEGGGKLNEKSPRFGKEP